jgi:DNA/RNA-binding domain of Phe-tRNA-synthetase-like protein
MAPRSSEGAEDDRPVRGVVDRGVAEEFPGLYLRYAEVPAGSGKSPRGLKQRLAVLSDRFAGPQAVAFRTKPIPYAYRVFFRHIGLDPDEQPTPAEAVVLERMLKGGFVSANRLDDALAIAMIESGVPVQALDADRISGGLAIRPSVEGEVLEGRPTDLPAGTLVIADERGPLSLLFGAVGAGRGVSPKTTRTTLVVIGVAGVPEIAVEEALWLTSELMLGD